MNHAITKIVGAAAGVTLLAPGAVAFGDTVEVAAPDASGATWSHVEGTTSTVESPVVNVPNDSGGFSYQQSGRDSELEDSRGVPKSRKRPLQCDDRAYGNGGGRLEPYRIGGCRERVHGRLSAS